MGFVLHTFRLWWKWATPLGILLAAGAASIVCFVVKPTYEAVGWIRIDDRPAAVLDSRTDDTRATKAYVNTQIQTLRHPVVLGAVLADPKVAAVEGIATESDPVQGLAKRIQIKCQGESEIYGVSFQSHDAEMAAWVVNAVLDQYFLHLGMEAASHNEPIIKMLEAEKKNWEKTVRGLQDSVRELSKAATGEDPFVANLEPMVSAKHPLADVQERLVAAQVEQAVLKARLRAADQALKTAVEESQGTAPAAAIDPEVESKIDESPTIRALQIRLAWKRSRLQDLASRCAHGLNDPRCKGAEEDIRIEESGMESAVEFVAPADHYGCCHVAKSKAERTAGYPGSRPEPIYHHGRRIVQAATRGV